MGDAAHSPVTEDAALGDARITAAAISMVISALREVSTDSDVMVRRLENAAYFFEAGSPAFNKVQEFINNPKTNPLGRAQTGRVDVRIENILQLTGTTWQAEWKEVYRTTGGQIEGVSEMKGTFTLSSHREVTLASLYVNPTGLSIEDFTWSERIKIR